MRSRGQWQSSPYSPSRDYGHPQTNISPTQGETGNVQYTPRAVIGYETSPLPGFVSHLFPNFPAAQETQAPFATTDARPQPQEASADVQTRSFIVTMVPSDTPQSSVIKVLPVSCSTNMIMKDVKTDYIKVQDYKSLELICLKHIKEKNMFAFSFADIEEAIDAMTKFRTSHPEWYISPAIAKEIAGITRVSELFQESPHGVFILSVDVPIQRSREPYFDGSVETMITMFGRLENFVVIEKGARLRRYRVQYCNIRHGACAFTCLDELVCEVLIPSRDLFEITKC
jgi:hypothetical protein